MINVGVIGPEDLVQKVIQAGAAFELLSLIPMGYTSELEAVKLVAQNDREIDIILFTGPIPYLLVRHSGICSKPMYYVAYSTGALYGILLSYIGEKGWDKGRPFRISIDTLDRESVEAMLDDFGAADYSVYAYEDLYQTSAEELAHFHTELFEEGKVDLSVTGLASAYHLMQGANIPAYRLTITDLAIQAALSLVELEANRLLVRNGEVCVGVIKLVDRAEAEGKRLSEYEYRRQQLVFMNILVNYCEEIKAAMRVDDDNTFVFRSNAMSVSSFMVEDCKNRFLLDKTKDMPFWVCIGIALGNTSNEAESNAFIAVHEAVKNQRSNCVLYTGKNKTVSIGNASVKDTKYDRPVRRSDEQLRQLAKRSGVSYSCILKLVLCSSIREDGTFTADEYAKTLNVSSRSARRMIQKIEELGGIVEVGHEQPAKRGRPRRVYHLL